jgi:hypothetical protein
MISIHTYNESGLLDGVMRHMNDRDFVASIITEIVHYIAGLLDLLRLLEV